MQALATVNLQVCKTKPKKAKRAPAVPAGDGHVVITFAPNGAAEAAYVDTAPFMGTAVGRCIETQFKKARVPAFDGTAIHVGKNFKIE